MTFTTVRVVASLLAMTMALGANIAQAALTLTADGIAKGYTLSLFANNFETFTGFGNTYGPLGVGFTSAGVLVSSANGKMYLFANDVDNQNAQNPAQATVTFNYGVFNSLGMASAGGTNYMATHFQNSVVVINPNGTPSGTTVVQNGVLTSARDVVVHPNGHFYISGSQGIFEYDPFNNVLTTFVAGDTDGLSLSADGSILYAARNFNHIEGYNTTTKVKVYDSGSVALVDGTAIGTGTLAGKIIANTNLGEVWEIDLTNPANNRVIANLGTRGDLVKVDPNNGTLLLTQTSEVYRLAPPTGGGFVGANDATPEPSTLVMMSTALVAFGLARWRKRPTSSLANQPL